MTKPLHSKMLVELPQFDKLEDSTDVENSNEDKESPQKIAKANEITQVPLQERHPLEFTVILIGTTALAFNAGFVNGCTFQLRNISVSHVTGISTHVGMNIAQHDWDMLAINLATIISFIFGASITGYMMPQNSFHLGREYGPLFIIGSLLFALACALSYHWPNSMYYFYFAAMACGLQNGLTSKYSGNIIRTTHMTGTATDIGLVLGRVCKGDRKEIWKLQVLLPIYISFIIGGTVSVPAFRKLGKLSLLINVVVFFSIGLAYSITITNQLHIPLWKSFFGYYVAIEQNVEKAKHKIKHVVKLTKDGNPLHINFGGKKQRGGNDNNNDDDDDWEET